MNGLASLRTNGRSLFTDPFEEWLDFFTPAQRSGMVPLNLYQKNGAFVVEVSVPGYKEEDLTIQAHKGNLRVSGEKKESQEIQQYLTREICQGSFSRDFTLPEGCDPDKIRAELKDGILRLTIPSESLKKQEPKKIQISN